MINFEMCIIEAMVAQFCNGSEPDRYCQNCLGQIGGTQDIVKPLIRRKFPTIGYFWYVETHSATLALDSPFYKISVDTLAEFIRYCQLKSLDECEKCMDLYTVSYFDKKYGLYKEMCKCGKYLVLVKIIWRWTCNIKTKYKQIQHESVLDVLLDVL